MCINNLQAVKKSPANKQMEMEIKKNMLCVMLCNVVMRCLQHVSLNDATQKNLSLSASINIRRIA